MISATSTVQQVDPAAAEAGQLPDPQAAVGADQDQGAIAGAIPWLLLRAVSNQGDGVLAEVDFIQRIKTRGGIAPTGACDPEQDSTLAVPYRALYLFYSDGQ